MIFLSHNQKDKPVVEQVAERSSQGDQRPDEDHSSENG